MPQNVTQKAYSFDSHNQTLNSAHSPTIDQINPKTRETKTEDPVDSAVFPSRTDASNGFNPNNMNRGSIPAPGPIQWLLPNDMIDACPVFTPNTYQNWRREAKLRKMAQVGGNQTQLISKIVTALPLNSRMGALSYLESAASNPESLSAAAVMQISNDRYGKTDSERAWAWLSSFAEFKRENAENYKDRWARFARCAESSNARGMDLAESIIPHRPIQAMGLPGGKLPILLAALETSPNPTSITTLMELSIKMYET